MVQKKYTEYCERPAKNSIERKKNDAQVKVIDKAVMIAGNIMLVSIF